MKTLRPFVVNFFGLDSNLTQCKTRTERRDALLSPSSIILTMEMDIVDPNIFYKLDYIASFIAKAGLKPYGPKGRQYFTAAVSDLMETGNYDLATNCQRCHKWFYTTSMNEKLLNLFLQHWKDDTVYEEVILCKKCGGQLEEEDNTGKNE